MPRPREPDCGVLGSAEPLAHRRRPMSTSLLWNLWMLGLSGVLGGGMSGRNGQRTPGTARGSPRRFRTAKASRISRRAVKSRCACERGGWGRLSVDGPGHYNPVRSEDPWGRWSIHLMAVCNRARRPDSERCHRCGNEVHEGRMQTDRRSAHAGSRLKLIRFGKALPDKPAFQPYWGKPAVRNDRGIEETSASFEARSAPRSHPTRPYLWRRSNCCAVGHRRLRPINGSLVARRRSRWAGAVARRSSTCWRVDLAPCENQEAPAGGRQGGRGDDCWGQKVPWRRYLAGRCRMTTARAASSR
jgi:hypothetical protein